MVLWDTANTSRPFFTFHCSRILTPKALLPLAAARACICARHGDKPARYWRHACPPPPPSATPGHRRGCSTTTATAAAHSRTALGLWTIAALRGPGRKCGTPISRWQQQLMSRIGVPDHAPGSRVGGLPPARGELELLGRGDITAIERLSERGKRRHEGQVVYKRRWSTSGGREAVRPLTSQSAAGCTGPFRRSGPCAGGNFLRAETPR